MKNIEVVAAVVINNGKVLMTTRPPGKPPAGVEFPGGKVEYNETLSMALQRELREELAVSSIVSDPIYLLRRPKLRIWFMRTRLLGIPHPCEGQQINWYSLNTIPPPELLSNDLEFWNFLNF